MISQFAILGDSVTTNTGTLSWAGGGTGTWAERIAELLADIPSIGPILSSGIRHVGLGLVGSGEWTKSGSWTATVSTDSWDKSPYGKDEYANGLAITKTWTKPGSWTRPIVGTTFYFTDYTNGGNWQFRIDGGAWTNIGQALQHDNVLCKFYVAGSVASTIDIRAGDGSSGVGCLPVGVEVWFADPLTVTQGVIFHYLALANHQLTSLALSGSGDRLAWFDSVRAGTGSPITNRPNAGTLIFHVNDVSNTTSQWNSDLTVINTRVSSIGPIGLIVPWEMATSKAAYATQVAWRNQSHTTATALSMKIIDINDLWTGNGWGTGSGTQIAVTQAANLINADGVHPLVKAQSDITPRIYWFVRNQILGLGSITTIYPETASKPSVAYSSSIPSKSYNSSLPIGVT